MHEFEELIVWLEGESKKLSSIKRSGSCSRKRLVS